MRQIAAGLRLVQERVLSSAPGGGGGGGPILRPSPIFESFSFSLIDEAPKIPTVHKSVALEITSLSGSLAMGVIGQVCGTCPGPQIAALRGLQGCLKAACRDSESPPSSSSSSSKSP